MKQQASCNPKTPALFLDNQLSDDEQSAFEVHLSTCDACCQQLEQLAADGDTWSEVHNYLLPGSDTDDISETNWGDEAATWLDEDETPAVLLDFLAPTDDPRMLGRVGGYEVAGVIGSGGMGVVLKAFDGALNRYVAIKVLAPHLAASGAARRRFAREAQAAAAVVHENVIAIHGVSEIRGLPYLVMPYVRRSSLQKRIDQAGVLGLNEVLRVGMQTAAGLAAAHAQGLVHRDIKPANILLAEGVERVKITDFGLARAVDDASLTRTGVIAGTPQFMSPEQARGEGVDPRSDLFSLGAVMYAMCTGRPPFRAETSYGVLQRICETEPRAIREINPDVPDWLCAIIGKLLTKSPADRYQSAAEVANQLSDCLAHLQQPTVTPLPRDLPKALPAKPRSTKTRKSSLGLVVAAVSLLVVLAVVAGTQLSGVFKERTPADSRPVGGDRPTTLQKNNTAVGSPVDSQQNIGESQADLEWDDGVSESLQDVQLDVGQLEQTSDTLDQEAEDTKGHE